MSTKIYNGRRVRLRFLSLFFDRVNAKAIKIATERVKLLMGQIRPDYLETRMQDRVKAGKIPITPDELMLRITLERCYVASKSNVRDTSFCIDYGLNVWPNHDGWTYVIPIGEWWITDGIQWPVSESYFYWNNTDKPARVSHKEWESRRQNWTEVCLDDHDARRCWHPIIDVKERTGLHKIAGKILDDQDAVLRTIYGLDAA